MQLSGSVNIEVAENDILKAAAKIMRDRLYDAVERCPELSLDDRQNIDLHDWSTLMMADGSAERTGGDLPNLVLSICYDYEPPKIVLEMPDKYRRMYLAVQALEENCK